MVEREKIFTTKLNYNGIFNFNDFYNFCYNWMKDETKLDIIERKYSEKITGDTKKVVFEWEGTREVTDYFKLEVKFNFDVNGLGKVEINQDGHKIQTNKGGVEIKMEGTLIKDYKGRFETNPMFKFMRGMYERFIIPARIEEMKERLQGEVDEILSQIKAWLDLEGRK